MEIFAINEKEYVLPEGYEVDTIFGKETIFCDDFACEVSSDEQGRPQIHGPGDTIAPLKLAAAVMLGRKGGSVTSDAKAKAARKNGLLGGRPPKEKS